MLATADTPQDTEFIPQGSLMNCLKKTLALAALMACLTPVVQADDAPDNYIGVMGSYVIPDSNSVAKNGYGGHFIYGSPINEWLSVELNGFGHRLSAKSGFSGSASEFGAGLDLRGNILMTPYLNVFGLGGIGASYTDFFATGNKGVAPYINLGGGVLVPLTPSFALRADARYYGLLSGRIINGQRLVNEGRFNAGLQFSFGDEHIAPPVQPPPPPAPVQVVDVDSDGDGVLDSVDACPNTPPGTTVDASGCPLREIVPIAIPPADTDGDGVPDSLDRCPGTAPGLNVDANGCVIKQTLVLRNITFVTDSCVLTADSKAVIDKLADSMNGQPGMMVEIDGHTDTVGTQDYNLKLSQARAKTVRLYLHEKGIKMNRMTVDGFGFFKPVADNNTEEGRALNRRVEFKVLTP
jgi:OOP family OmpA-OmpF porin